MPRKNKKKSKPAIFEYCIENVTTMDTFSLQCKSLKDNLIDLVTEDLIKSDDGSPMQFYAYRDMEITVMYDIELEEVYIDCPFDIEDYIVKSQG